MEVTHLVSIDPGVRDLWWCAWSPSAKVNRMGRLKVKSPYQVSTFFYQFKGALLILERPIIVRNGRFGQARPDDIINLAMSAAWCETAPWLEVVRYKPAEWKGSTPKDVHNKRVLRQLSHSEREILDAAKVPASLKSNLIDAIGIGLYFLRAKGLRE